VIGQDFNFVNLPALFNGVGLNAFLFFFRDLENKSSSSIVLLERTIDGGPKTIKQCSSFKFDMKRV